MAGEYRKYASKSHHHRPAKGKGGYQRESVDLREVALGRHGEVMADRLEEELYRVLVRAWEGPR